MGRKVLTLTIITFVLLSVAGASGCSWLGFDKKGDSKSKTGQKVSKKDVTGKDIDGFPRYPGCVRTYYGEGKDTAGRPIIRVNYSASDPAEKVVMWFKDELSKKGSPPFSDVGSPSNEETLVYAFPGKTVTVAIQNVDPKQTWIIIEEMTSNN